MDGQHISDNLKMCVIHFHCGLCSINTVIPLSEFEDDATSHDTVLHTIRLIFPVKQSTLGQLGPWVMGHLPNPHTSDCPIIAQQLIRPSRFVKHQISAVRVKLGRWSFSFSLSKPFLTKQYKSKGVRNGSNSMCTSSVSCVCQQNILYCEVIQGCLCTMSKTCTGPFRDSGFHTFFIHNSEKKTSKIHIYYFVSTF